MRTVKVGNKERCSLVGKKYNPGPLTGIEVRVQRLVLLVPTNEAKLLMEPDVNEPTSANHNLEPKDEEDTADYALEALAGDADLKDDSSNVPRRRSRRLKKETKKVKSS